MVGLRLAFTLVPLHSLLFTNIEVLADTQISVAAHGRSATKNIYMVVQDMIAPI
jgi:hypothetical protein